MDKEKAESEKQASKDNNNNGIQSESEEDEEDDDFVVDEIAKQEVVGEELQQPEKAETEEELASNFSKMSLTVKEFQIDQVLPHLMYSYVEDDRRRVVVDFAIPPTNKKCVKVEMAPGGQVLEVKMAVPSFFLKKGRLMAAHLDKANFTHNTHKATAFDELVTKIRKKHGKDEYDDEDGEEELIFGAPMKVKMPFPCEEEIVNWELQAFDMEDEDLLSEIGEMQYAFVLSVELVSVEKKKKKRKGGFRVVGSPSGRTTGTAPPTAVYDMDE